MRYIKKISRLIYYLFNFSSFKYLDFKAVVFFSVRVSGKKYISIGKGAVVQRHGWLLALKYDDTPPEIIIEDFCAVGDFCHITAIRSVHLEKNVLIANNVYISDNLHGYQDINTPIMHQPVLLKGPVRIGSGAWIGENVCIMGASVGRNAVIGANSVVTKDIPDYCVAIGSPAKVIKRFDLTTNTWISVSEEKR